MRSGSFRRPIDLLFEGASMYAAVEVPGQATPSTNPIKVMIVDGSAVVRGLVARWVEEESGLEVVAPRQWQAGGRRHRPQRPRHSPAGYRDAGDGRPRSTAPAAGCPTRDARLDGLDAHQTQRRDQLLGTGARRPGLCAQARYEPRDIDVARLSPRSDPQVQVARSGAHPPKPKSRRYAGGGDR
jgi:hypothetical protein